VCSRPITFLTDPKNSGSTHLSPLVRRSLSPAPSHESPSPACATTHDPRKFSDPDFQSEGLKKHQLNRNVRRDGRLFLLEKNSTKLTFAEQKELDGLMAKGLKYEEQYSCLSFTDEHVEFKQKHNDVFIKLIDYIHEKELNSDSSSSPINVFYLDGPDAASSFALKKAGIDPERCFVANRHESTCHTLLEKIPGINAVHATASDALLNAFGIVHISAYYFDGCGGYPPLINDMISAALSEQRYQSQPNAIAIGFSILGGNRDVVDKEKVVIQNLVRMAKRFGLRVDHVLDDPERYKIPLDVQKIEGGTMATWVMLERDTRD